MLPEGNWRKVDHARTADTVDPEYLIEEAVQEETDRGNITEALESTDATATNEFRDGHVHEELQSDRRRRNNTTEHPESMRCIRYGSMS